MGGAAAGHLPDAPAIVLDFAGEERVVEGGSVAVRVQLDIDAALGQLSDFVRGQVVQYSPFEEGFVIDAELESQRGEQRVFVLRLQLPLAGDRQYLDLRSVARGLVSQVDPGRPPAEFSKIESRVSPFPKQI